MTMTYHSRKYFSRSSHTNYSKRTLIWNSSLFQKSNFYRLLLGFLSLKPHSNTWTRQVLTTYRNLPSQSLRSLTFEYLCTISLCGINHMSSWQPHRRKWKAYTLSFFFNHNHPGIYLTPLQDSEYYKTSFTISDGVYGSTFFIATWFHGLHVLIGSTFVVCLCQLKFHFWFWSCWYCYFINVVWWFLYVSICCWGSYSFTINRYNWLPVN